MDVSVGTRLRVLRKDAGLTQAQLAALADTNQAVEPRSRRKLRRIANRRQMPSTATKLTGRQRLTASWSGMPPILMCPWTISSVCARTPAGGMSVLRQRERRKWCSANRIGVSLWRLASRRAAS